VATYSSQLPLIGPKKSDIAAAAIPLLPDHITAYESAFCQAYNPNLFENGFG